MDTVTTLYLIRHAEVEASYQGVFGGRIDMDISPRGHEQAAALARYLKRKKFDAIYASPMKRVQQTLSPYANNGGPKPVLIDNFREVHFGDWTGLTFAQVLERFGARASSWLDQLVAGTIPHAETAAAYRNRIEPPVREILKKHSGQHVAVFCHGGVIRQILSILIEIPLARTAGFEIDYASLTEVEIFPHRAEVRLLNFTPWRDFES
ncbi:MAG TPA: histidine phosphatase family protein [Verrucomicrobiae bacterium]|nr:histidine phosphatase family protein [Verrucomicrobiae bacterium]